MDADRNWNIKKRTGKRRSLTGGEKRMEGQGGRGSDASTCLPAQTGKNTFYRKGRKRLIQILKERGFRPTLDGGKRWHETRTKKGSRKSDREGSIKKKNDVTWRRKKRNAKKKERGVSSGGRTWKEKASGGVVCVPRRNKAGGGQVEQT